MGHYIYNIFIMPLELLFQFVYSLANSVFSNPGVCIIAISIVMNLLVLPLYKRADDVQEAERKKQKDMEHWVKHIRNTFRGDERFMMLSTYYRQQNYHPLYAVKSSLSLLLQIPFFIAAYHFLSNLDALNGQSFWFLDDLGKPDALLTIGAVSINLLPILMTLINFLSGEIYTKGFPIREKVQLYGVAIIFLILLYRSPSGLVFYWTLNNLFSLGKNIFFKVLPNPQKVLRWVVAILGAGVSIFACCAGRIGTPQSKLFFFGLIVLCLCPLLWSWVRKEDREKFHKPNLSFAIGSQGTKVFFLSAIILILLCGVYIPSSVIAASPAEFISGNHSSLYLVFNTLSLYIGLFLWVSIFYLLAKEKTRAVFSCVLWLLTGVALVNFLFFGKEYGLISTLLVYDTSPAWNMRGYCINFAVLFVIGTLCFLLLKKYPKVVQRLCPLIIVGVLCVSVYNCVGIVSESKKARELLEAGSASATEKIIPLSKEGKNVVVIMLDRAISGYIPYIFHEKPELYEKFDGFTYYPNTISLGGCTNYSTPSLFGGYEYSPEAINSRTEKPLVEEQNEALTVLPKLFSDNGYTVTVCDPPYAGYSQVPDLSIYDAYDGIHAYITTDVYKEDYQKKLFAGEHMKSLQEKNFFYYSLFKIFPTFFEPVFYDDGKYNNNEDKYSLNESFIGEYSTLVNLENMTEIQEGKENTFLMFQNSTTHEPTELSVPDYSPILTGVSPRSYYEENQYLTLNGKTVDIERDDQLVHYQTNVAAMLALGNWFDWMKENDLYDNTKIIIVSDHGKSMAQFDEMLLDNGIDVERFNSLMLVKDFGETGKLVTSDELMTAADVPTLATENAIENPVNPFTGNAINSDAKSDVKITTSISWDITKNNGTTFVGSEEKWYTVKDSIFDVNNWTEVTE